MIYLLSQMLLVTAIAVIVGAAFGWLIHRSMYAGRVHQLQQTVRHQRAQVTQAKSDVTMLNDDYDELKRSAHDQIITLQTANQQIPELLTNLEQSQLLAQQNMKRHESRERNLSVENKRLEEQIAELMHNAPEAGSRFTKEPSAFSSKIHSQDSKSEIAPDAPNAKTRSQASNSEIASDTPQVKTRSQAPSNEIASDTPQAKTRSQAPNSEIASDTPQVKTRSQAPNSELVSDAPLVNAHSQVASVNRIPDVPHGLIQVSEESSMDMTLAPSEFPTDVSDTENPLDGSSLDMTQNAPVFSASELDDEDLFGESSLDMTQAAPAFTVAELDNDPFDQVMEVDDDFQLDFDQTNDTASQTALDDTARPAIQKISTSTLEMLDIGAETEEEELSRVKDELAAERARFSNDDMNSSLQPDSQQGLQPHSQTRFTPSKTADDLQQIFGIGPLTEIALNELGITSYSQLAQLEKHDIQHIADALEIGPGRIERDNWVGNARSQLEDVLEEL